MASNIVKCLISIIFFTLIIKGLCVCTINNIQIGTQRSGREIKRKPEWNVSVINNCACPQSQIKLLCKGFQTEEPVDPNILSKDGDNCLLINGNTLQAFNTVKFSYAWDPPFLFWPKYSLVGSC
ncbi:hypothetical protein Lal_00035176 [Lupinus albus]|uniref:Uncharacterized protein n=1 Tax=Lupinus albus TaxID=3870 RepID=A0A6A5PLG3_LUPAL|nr:hypothetical protein Lalb_Chr03g0036441 [Lupinus albus]KAF1897470.1 hypothetical protein Lal_00035176 [Lupinus albus]